LEVNGIYRGGGQGELTVPIRQTDSVATPVEPSLLRSNIDTGGAEGIAVRYDRHSRRMFVYIVTDDEEGRVPTVLTSFEWKPRRSRR
ncbi:hypothetical protein FOZ63_025794, partial [Perkinsus olseni]